MTPERVAVILAGAGARGAYEAGVLSVLLLSGGSDVPWCTTATAPGRQPAHTTSRSAT